MHLQRPGGQGQPSAAAKLYKMLQPVLAERFHLHGLRRQDRTCQIKVSPVMIADCFSIDDTEFQKRIIATRGPVKTLVLDHVEHPTPN